MIQSMKWDEFLLKLSLLKKSGGKTGFNMGVLTRLIFADAFRSMIKDDPEYMKMPPVDRCLRMTREAAEVLKSKAKLPKATKNEPIGIEDIHDTATLVLWRRQINPTFTFDMCSMYASKLNAILGFQKVKDPTVAKRTPLSLHREGKASSYVFSKWEHVFATPETHRHFNVHKDMSGRYTGSYACVVGIVTRTSPLRKKDGSIALSVMFFDGYDEYPVKLWPAKGSKKYDQGKAADLKIGATGLFFITPSLYNGQPDGSLIQFCSLS